MESSQYMFFYCLASFIPNSLGKSRLSSEYISGVFIFTLYMMYLYSAPFIFGIFEIYQNVF